MNPDENGDGIGNMPHKPALCDGRTGKMTLIRPKFKTGDVVTFEDSRGLHEFVIDTIILGPNSWEYQGVSYIDKKFLGQSRFSQDHVVHYSVSVRLV